METKEKIIKKAIIRVLLIFMFYPVFSQQPVDYAIQLTTSTVKDPPAISFIWNTIPGTSGISVYRKNKDVSGWGTSIASLPADAAGYTDNNVETGKEYEYKIIKTGDLKPTVTYVSSGINCKEIEYRGKIILLVDSTFTDVLHDEILNYETDLIGDGWEILRKDISRDASVRYVKSIIRNFYNSDSANVKDVFLFGHIPVPYSGCEAYDGHDEHYGAWPADIYYGDMNENAWTDESANCTGATRSENRNIPGDGKFDVTYLPYSDVITLAIGRIDFCNLPAFSKSESELLKNYLIKNHNFRHKINNPKLQGLVKDNFGMLYNEGVAIGAWRNFTALFNFSNVKAGEYFSGMKYESYMWSYGCGGGEFTSCNGVGTTTDFVNQSPLTVFTGLYGSWYGDWDSQNNFMRSALASNGWTLTCFWSGRPLYTFHQMGMGATIGYCTRITENSIDTYEQQEYNRFVHESLLGDPTLRMHIVCPVNSLQSAITADSTIMLAWKPSDDTIIGYNVYKLDTLTNKYIKITASPVTETYFEDTLPVAGNNYYMVRTLKLTRVAGGSYYNLSQGIFDTIDFIDQTPVLVSEINLSFEPGAAQPIVYETFSVNAGILPSNATNKLLKWSIENIAGDGKFDKYGKVYPERGGNIAIIAEALDGSGISGRLEITIDSIPEQAGAITGEPSVCRDNTSKLYQVPAIRGATSYIWTLPNGISDTTGLNEITYVLNSSSVSGYIKVKGSNIFPVGNENEIFITVNDIPPAPVITLLGNSLHSNAPLGNQWYINSTLIQYANESIFIPMQRGYYSASVMLNNCLSGRSNSINFDPTSFAITGLTNKALIFPNPTNGLLNIDFRHLVRYAEVKIFNLQGINVFSKTFYNTSGADVDLAGLPKGMYLIRVMVEGNIFENKIIKTQ